VIPSNGRPRRVQKLAATVLFAGLVAGCGGSSGGAQAGDGPPSSGTAAPAVSVPLDQPQKPACGMITVAEVEAAIGAKVSPAKAETREGRSLCSFSLASKAEESVVLISTTSSGVPAYYASAFNKASSPQTVTAGDQAFVSGPSGLVRKGDTMVAILVVLRQAPAQLQAAATKLTQAVGTHI
jgi:hypothetical protein